MPLMRKTVCHNRKAVLFGGQVLYPRADHVRGVFEEVTTKSWQRRKKIHDPRASAPGACHRRLVLRFRGYSGTVALPVLSADKRKAE
jgi:hypothetical protein